MRYLIFSAFLFLSLNSHAQQSLEQLMRSRLEGLEPDEVLQIKGKDLLATDQIHDFYASRGFDPVWIDNGEPNRNSLDFAQTIEESVLDGLNPANYHSKVIKEFGIKEGQFETLELLQLELLLTDAFFGLSHDLHEGKVDHKSLKPDWEIKPKVPRYRYDQLLEEISQGATIPSTIPKLYPKFNIYSQSREVIRNLLVLKERESDNWSDLKLDGLLKVGMTSSIVPELKKRLVIWGYLDSVRSNGSKEYDSFTQEAIKNFQRSVAMEDDGVIGERTLKALNTTLDQLIKIASANLERMRWLPDGDYEGPVVLVNIANYSLDYIQDQDTLLSEKVIVGKRFHETPIFQQEISYLVFSPYWNIPYSITHNEILPKARKDPSYISSKNMEIVSNDGQVVSTDKVDWESSKFPYRIRQKPGETNSLGLVKFIFPNNHSVYIHDTPARYLFAKEERAMSHGCIRVENPQDLAKILLSNQSEWSEEKIFEAMHQDKEEVVYLKKKVPVVLLYLTFWANGSGKGNFRPDIYNRDEAIIEALFN